jgi:hypothetical protein
MLLSYRRQTLLRPFRIRKHGQCRVKQREIMPLCNSIRLANVTIWLLTPFVCPTQHRRVAVHTWVCQGLAPVVRHHAGMLWTSVPVSRLLHNRRTHENLIQTASVPGDVLLARMSLFPMLEHMSLVPYSCLQTCPADSVLARAQVQHGLAFYSTPMPESNVVLWI